MISDGSNSLSNSQSQAKNESSEEENNASEDMISMHKSKKSNATNLNNSGKSFMRDDSSDEEGK